MGIILIFVVALVAVLLINAAKFKATDNGVRTAEPVTVNSERARANLSTLVKFETVSNADYDKTDKEVFLYTGTRKKDEDIQIFDTEWWNATYRKGGK